MDQDRPEIHQAKDQDHRPQILDPRSRTLDPSEIDPAPPTEWTCIDGGPTPTIFPVDQ